MSEPLKTIPGYHFDRPELEDLYAMISAEDLPVKPVRVGYRFSFDRPIGDVVTVMLDFGGTARQDELVHENLYPLMVLVDRWAMKHFEDVVAVTNVSF